MGYLWELCHCVRDFVFETRAIRLVGAKTIEVPKTVRRQQRYLTHFIGTLIVNRQPQLVEIVDLSCIGACVRGQGLPMRGQEIVLIAPGLEVVATVVWCDDRSCGVNFHRPIAPLAIVRSNPYLPNLNTRTPAVAMRG